MRRKSVRRIGRALGVVAIMATALLTSAPTAGAAASPTASTPWALMKTPYLLGSATADTLAGVSCPAVNFCMTVGGQGQQESTKPLAEVWRGKSWSVTPTHNPAPGVFGGSQFLSVSCGLINSCLAVGTTSGNGFAELWNGLAWSAPMTISVGFGAVSCVAKNCVVVGSNLNEAGSVADFWDGHTWTPSTMGTAASTSSLRAVSCVAFDNCLAVGDATRNTNTSSLTAGQYLSGPTWSNETPPSPPQYPALAGVSCVNAPAVTCMAVGSNGDIPMADTFDASTQTWTATQPGTTPTGFPEDFLGVSCPTSSWCVAVGAYNEAVYLGGPPLAEAWNGSTWTVMNTGPVSGTGTNPSYTFTSVSCPSSTFCVAVGSRLGLAGQLPEIASWGTAP